MGVCLIDVTGIVWRFREAVFAPEGIPAKQAQARTDGGKHRKYGIPKDLGVYHLLSDFEGGGNFCAGPSLEEND
jgi:hypothetical protein